MKLLAWDVARDRVTSNPSPAHPLEVLIEKIALSLRTRGTGSVTQRIFTRAYPSEPVLATEDVTITAHATVYSNGVLLEGEQAWWAVARVYAAMSSNEAKRLETAQA